MKFTLTNGINHTEFEFRSNDPGREEIIYEVLTAMNRINELSSSSKYFLEKYLPLPTNGCMEARYVGDMRELAQYAINIDGYNVRHDWMAGGQKMTDISEPIRHYEIPTHSKDEFEAAILIRRNAVLERRGVAR